LRWVFPQPLKPDVDFIGIIGTTEVMPCYKASAGLDNKAIRDCADFAFTKL